MIETASAQYLHSLLHKHNAIAYSPVPPEVR